MQRRSFLSTLALPAWAAAGLAGCGGGGGAADPGVPTAPERHQVVGSFVVSNHAAVGLPDGSVIVIGGDRALNALSESVDRFDPTTRRFTRIGSLASGRASHTALALHDGRILVAGGMTSLELPPFAEIIDAQRGTVVDAGRMAASRQGHTMTLLADGRVLVTGGSGRSSAELWDPATNAWRLLPSRLRHARAGHSATLLADGRVLIAGGDAMQSAGYVFAELWDPRSEAFTVLDSGVTEPSMLHAAWRAGDGSVYLVGGELATGEALVPLASALRFEPATQRFAAAPSLAQARTLAVPLPASDGGALLIGGQTAGERATRRFAAWSPSRGELPLPELPAPRLWHSAHRLPDGRVLVLGGEDGLGRHVAEVLLVS